MTDNAGDQAILNLINAYPILFDKGDIEGVVSLFADDATVRIIPDPGFFPSELNGKEAIREAYLRRAKEVADGEWRRHLQLSAVVKHAAPGSAMVTSTFASLGRDTTGALVPLNTGIYEDEVAQEGDEWLIRSRTIRLDVASAEDGDGPVEVSADGDDLESEISREIGYQLPHAVAEYTKVDPAMFSAYREFRSELLDTGTLPRRLKLLMAISILTATKQGEAMDMYASIARQEGATPAEIREALRVGILFSGGPGIAAAASVAVKYGSDVDS